MKLLKFLGILFFTLNIQSTGICNNLDLNISNEFTDRIYGSLLDSLSIKTIDVNATLPDLTISKVAVGAPFQQGGTLAYTLTVTNGGNGPTTGTINVTDIIPTGLTVTSATGTNWTCSGSSTITCTRTVAMAAGSSSAITLQANIASNAPASITNTANVSGGGDANTSNNAGSSVISVAAVSPDLTISKVAVGAPFQQGGTLAYTLTVTNGGNGPTTGTITVTDIIPTGLTVTSATGTNWTCTGTATITCTRSIALAAGSSSAITLQANIASNAPASITNTVNVSGGGDANTSNNAGSSVISVAAVSPDLTISKVAVGAPFQQGGTLAYTLTVTNGGNGPTTGTITVTDIIPTGLTVTSATGTNWTCTGTSTITCTRSIALAAGSSSAITLQANIASNAPASITNTVNVSGGGDANTGNNAGSSVINVAAVSPELTITKVAVGGPFQQGGSMSYTLTVTNGGNGPTTGTITVTDIIPTGLIVTSATGTNWTCTGTSTITCTRSIALAAGSSSAITLQANIASNAPASITNTVNVSGGGDANTGNNAGSSVINVAAVSPELTITKVAVGGPFQQGGSMSYTLTVTNGGNGPTTGTITVTDIIPTGLTVTSATGTNWTCTGTSTITCTRSLALAAGSSSAITLQANIASNAPASITNTVNVSGGGDANTGNNAGSSVINVAAVSPDLTITKTVTGSSFQQSGQAVFNLIVSNVGNGPTIGNITVTDNIPTGLQIVSVSGMGWTCSTVSNSITCSTLASLASFAQSTKIQIITNIASNAPTSITNTATVSGGSETVTTNNSGSTSFSVLTGTAPNIGSPILNFVHLCQGSNIQIGLSTSGSFLSGNQFEVQLSDENGSFLTPYVIGNSNVSGNISCLIPNIISSGTNYLIRVISSKPYVIGSPLPGITISQSQASINLSSPADNYTGLVVKKSTNTIVASNKILTPAHVVYHALNSILLEPGFDTKEVFKAEIKGCNQ